MEYIKIGFLAVFAYYLFFSHTAASNLGMDEYLKQVNSGNILIKSLSESAEGAKKQIQEQMLLSSPWMFSGIQHAVDKSPSLESFFTGDSRLFENINFGVEQKTDFGLTGRISYSISYYSIDGLQPIIIPIGSQVLRFDFISTPKYYNDKLALELKLDLLRNSLGREMKSTKNAILFKHEASYYEKKFQGKQVLTQAEIVYWQLVLARETVKIHEQLLERANKLDSWMQERIKLNLQDESDINQSKSEVQYRKLELKGAVDAQKSAARTFNLLRGIDSDIVEEELNLPEDIDLENKITNADLEKRWDFIALLKNLEALKASASMKKEVLYPELSIGASASLNGQDSAFGRAFSNSIGSDNYVYGIGVNFRMPLNFPADSLSNGYDSEYKSLEKYIENKRLELKMELSELTRKLADTKERLALAIELERLQKNKADAERDRLNKGNSVTYQVLSFEQDWSKSQLGVIQIKQGILEIIARIKLFETNSYIEEVK